MERWWFVYTMTLQILAAIADAAEDFRHISYEGKCVCDKFSRSKFAILIVAGSRGKSNARILHLRIAST